MNAGSSETAQRNRARMWASQRYMRSPQQTCLCPRHIRPVALVVCLPKHRWSQGPGVNEACLWGPSELVNSTQTQLDSEPPSLFSFILSFAPFPSFFPDLYPSSVHHLCLFFNEGGTCPLFERGLTFVYHPKPRLVCLRHLGSLLLSSSLEKRSCVNHECI